MNVVYDDNRHLKSFFQHNQQDEAAVCRDIATRLPHLIAENSPKIKTAYSLRHHGKKIYEYKVIASKNLTCRVAYIHDSQTITVIFISETLIKRQFCHLLANTELVD